MLKLVKLLKIWRDVFKDRQDRIAPPTAESAVNSLHGVYGISCAVSELEFRIRGNTIVFEGEDTSASVDKNA